MLGGQQREADSRKAIAEAQKATAAAQLEQVAALIPDLSKVERGTLELKGEQALFSAALGRGALDAAYLDVATGVGQLLGAAGALLDDLSEARARERGAGFAAGPVLAAVAQAIPGPLSLFSAHRTMTSASVTSDDLSAAAAAAGALRSAVGDAVLVHDDFRLLSHGALHNKLGDLAGKRQQLSARKMALEDEKARTGAQLSETRGSVEDVKSALAEAEGDVAARLQDQLVAERKEVANYEERLSKAEVRLGLIDSVSAAIDTFVASLTAAPEGANRSPLALAVMRERHQAGGDAAGGRDEEALTHVLLVKGGIGSVEQTVDDKPFLFKDRFSAVATATITYMLLDTARNAIVAAGNPSGSTAAQGKIGGEFEVTVKPVQLESQPR